MKIMIGADLVPTISNFEYFSSGDVEALLGNELLQLLDTADFRIFNLEVPLTDRKNPIVKWGPCLSAPQNTIAAMKKMNISLFTLANNHILDQGEVGLSDTCQLLTQNNIKYIGAGDNLEKARQPYIFEKDEIKVGIYACAEHEFSIAKEDRAGANPFDPFESLDHVLELKKQCDYVIVLYHGGKEHYRYPSPKLQKVCHKLVEKGADIVLTQHSHCIGAKEIYQNKLIVYGQGNFLFRKNDNNEYWSNGLLLEIQLNKAGLSTKFYPLIKSEIGIRLADNEERTDILDAFEERTKEIQQEGKIAELYNEFAKQMLIGYESAMLGKIGSSFMFRVINKLSGYRLIQKIFSGSNRVALYNALTCEAHYDLMIAGIVNEMQSENMNKV